ncbi:MAG: hypothetical protein U9N34_08090, partial [Candidatus Cloacimonadota bacterium]|nr:hypothetical protein [Candidatus Cloacimonadota bacterium]
KYEMYKKMIFIILRLLSSSNSLTKLSKKFMLRNYSIIFLILLMSCSGLSESQEVDDFEIKNILEDLALAFNSSDIDAILQNYHPQFTHNGNELHEERIIWQVRINDYEFLEIENISIEYLESYKAIVSFTAKFDEIEFSCPENISDFSYFYIMNNDWKIIGNQEQ